MLEINKKTIRNVLLVIAFGVVLYWALHDLERIKTIFGFLKSVFFPFLLGAAIAYVINVPMRAFEKLFKVIKNAFLRRLICFLLSIACVLLVVALVIWLLIPAIISTIQSLIPTITEFLMGAESTIRDFLSDNPALTDWVLKNTGMETLDWPTLVKEAVTRIGNSLTTILTSTINTIGGVASGLVTFVIATVFSIYCLFQKDALARQGKKLLYAYLPEKYADSTVRVFRLSNSMFSNFISGQCLEACILGALFAITMAIFKMPYIPLISVLIAVTALIPIVGAFIGCGIGAVLILMYDPILALWFVVMFVIIQQFENNVIYPRVVGTSIGLPGMWVLMAATVGGSLMGVTGMFVMIPIVSVIYTLLREKTNERLEMRNIAQEKLINQPPERRVRKSRKGKEK